MIMMMCTRMMIYDHDDDVEDVIMMRMMRMVVMPKGVRMMMIR